MNRSNTVSILVVAAAALSAAACNQLLGVEDLTQNEPDAGMEIDATPDIDAAPGTARVRILHVARALPGDGLIDVYVNDEPTPRFPAHGGLSDYITVSSEQPTKVSIRAQGQSGGAPLFEFDNLTFEDRADTTAVLTGIATSLTGDEAVRLIPVVDGYAQAGTGMTQVRFLNAVADLPTTAIDFDFYGESNPEISGLARFQTTPAAGTGHVSNAGLRFGLIENGVTIAGFAANALPVGVGCLVVLYGKVAEPRDTRDAVAAAMACRNTAASYLLPAERASVVHVLGDVQPPANATLLESPGSRSIASNIGARQTSTIWVAGEGAWAWSMGFPARTVDLGITNDFTGTTQFVLLGGALQPASGENDASAQTLFVESAPTTASRQIRFINMSVDLGSVELFDQTNATIGGGTFASWSGPTELAAGSYQLRLDEEGTAVATYPFTVAGAGGSTLLVLEGAHTPTSGQRPLRLTPIDLGVWPPQVGTPITPM